MADLLSNKLHHSFSRNLTAISLPLPSSHVNLSFTRFASFRQTKLSQSSSLLTKLSSSFNDIVSTFEQPDGTIVFKFDDAATAAPPSAEPSEAGDAAVDTQKDDPPAEPDPIFYHSPYPVYDDLKPPTSPTPSAPSFPSTSAAVADSTGSDMVVAMSSNGPVLEPAADADEQDSTVPKPTPHSPYTMYDDMKPPTSPTPSTPRVS